MAQRTYVELVDDLDGTSEKVKPVRKRRFTIDGVQYEADYTDENYAGLLADVAKYVESARVISRPKAVTPATGISKKRQKKIDAAQLAHMRDWLRRNGEQVSSYGKIPDRLVEKYHREGTPPPSNPQNPPQFDDQPQFMSA